MGVKSIIFTIPEVMEGVYMGVGGGQVGVGWEIL